MLLNWLLINHPCLEHREINNTLARLNPKLELYRDSYLASRRAIEIIAFCSTDFVWTINRARQVLFQLMGLSVPLGQICKGFAFMAKPLSFREHPFPVPFFIFLGVLLFQSCFLALERLKLTLMKLLLLFYNQNRIEQKNRFYLSKGIIL